MTNYLSKGIQGVFFIFILSFFANIAGYVTRTILARNLEISQYGLFYAIYSLVMFLTLFSYLGFGVTIIKYVAEFRAKKEYHNITFAILLPSVIMIFLSIPISFILYVSSDFLAINYFKSVEAVLVLKVFAFILLGMVLVNILSSTFRGFQSFLAAGLLTFSQKISFMLLVMLMLFLGVINLPFAAYSLLASFFVIFLVFLPKIISYRRYLTKPKFSKPLAGNMKTFALTSFLASLGGLVIVYIDTLMLTFFRSLEEVGIYNAVLPTVMVLGIFSISIRQVLAPLVSELWAKKLKKQLRMGLQILRRYSLIIIIPLILVLFAFPELIINLLFGERYVGGAVAMQILSFGIIFFTVGYMDLTVIRYIGKPKESTKIVLIGMTFNILANAILIPLAGINGAALATTLSYFLMMVLASRNLHKFMQVRLSVAFWIKVLSASLLFVGVVSLLKSIVMVNQFVEASISLVVAGLLYVGACYFLHLIRIDELKLFTKSLFFRK